MDLPDQLLPDGFLALPTELRERIAREGHSIGEAVIGHAVQIIIGPPWSLRNTGEVNHASGVQVEIDGSRYLATAAHVVRAGVSRTVEAPRAIFQVGNAVIPVADRVVFIDDSLDVAFVLLKSSEFQDIPSRCWVPQTWPPGRVSGNDYVAFAGFPRRYREIEPDGRVVLNGVGGVLRVESASDRRLTSVHERGDLILAKGPEIPPQGADLGGMSGGPVFRFSNSSLELVALIKEDSQLFDAYFFAPLSDVELNPAARVAVQ